MFSGLFHWRTQLSWWIRGTLALLLATALTGTIANAAQADGPLPAPGSIIERSAAINLPPELAQVATGVAVKYASLSQTGSRILVTGLILTPKSGAKNQVVAWAHGTTGWGYNCAPSRNNAVFWPEARQAVRSYLAAGYTVAATDYPGLGVKDLVHPYLVGKVLGQSVIDSVRAARALNSKLSKTWAVVGHSEGGQAALWAGEIAGNYAPELSLKLAVGLAPASNLDLLANGIVQSPYKGYFVGTAYGYDAAGALDAESLLTPAAQADASQFLRSCLYEGLAIYANYTPEQLVPGGVVPDSALAVFASVGNPAQPGHASVAPVLLVQGTADDTIPSDVTEYYLFPEECANGVATELLKIEGADHEGAVYDPVSLSTVSSRLAGAFAGSTPVNQC